MIVPVGPKTFPGLSHYSPILFKLFDRKIVPYQSQDIPTFVPFLEKIYIGNRFWERICGIFSRRLPIGSKEG